jgi:G:T-mismatch repair DNA endonuclease (very short patch repair protein)
MRINYINEYQNGKYSLDIYLNDN